MVWHLILVFFGRHWLLAVANAWLTAILSLGLLRLVHWPAISSLRRTSGPARWLRLPIRDADLRLPRFVTIIALWKGAFYMVVGDRHPIPLWYSFGYQFANPSEVLRLVPQTQYTIWRTTVESGTLGTVLGVIALLLLANRAREMVGAKAALEAMFAESAVFGDGDALRERVKRSLGRAANTSGLRRGATLPRPLLAEVPTVTPQLVGLHRPFILLAPSLVTALTDAELDAALRHELAHYRRRDHLWRWPLLWVQDMGRLNPVSGWLGAQVMAKEEELCDRSATSSPQEALSLAQAIMKTKNHRQDAPPPPHFARLSPCLTGMRSPTELERRVAGLTRLAQVLTARRPRRSGLLAILNTVASPLFWVWNLFLMLLVLMVTWGKFFIVISPK